MLFHINQGMYLKIVALVYWLSVIGLFQFIYVWIFLGVVLLLIGGWTALRYFDWANDYIVITNLHLIHNEFHLTKMRGFVKKIAIDQVQNVSTSQDFWDNLLGMGSVTINTASQQGGIEFKHLQNPEEIEGVLRKIKGRGKQIVQSREREDLRDVIAKHFKSPTEFKRIDGGGPSNQKPNEREFLRTQSINYERHWVVFWQDAWYWVAFLLMTIIATIAGIIFFPFVAIWIGIIGVVVSLGLLVPIYYYWEDSNNDRFQITKTQVIDVDKRPFSLEEDRKVADLSDVQNVLVERPSFWSSILDYGNVTIETAGASADLIFELVSNPNKVQSDIFDRRDWIKQQRQSAQRKQGHRDFLMMLEEYQRLKEQDKIPRRTQPLDYEFEDPTKSTDDLDW